MSIATAPESLGHDLRVLRKRRGLTQVEVAAALGRSVGWLSQVERNLSDPSPDELRQFASVFGISAESFFGGVPTRPEEADVIVRN